MVPLDSPYRLVFILGLFAGLRIGECLGMTWDDIDLTETKTIRVAKQLANTRYDGHSFQVLKSPKSKKSRRTIIVSDLVINELQYARKKQEQEKELLADHYLITQSETIYIGNRKVDRVLACPKLLPGNVQRDFIMRKADGGYVQSRAVDLFMSTIRKKTGIDFVTSHISRHTHASILSEEGFSLPNISARLGHALGSNITYSYMHATQGTDQKIADCFDALYNGKFPTTN